MVIKIDANNIDMDKIGEAAQVLRSGGTVAFPTETVYGLGANALDPVAVGKIFAAKGRPADNPLICHVSGENCFALLTDDWNDEQSVVGRRMRLLADAFWPGPLALVVRKTAAVPYEVTAGLDTVAIRVPSNPVALALIREANLPIAAPSANTSTKPSPTCARDVIEDLDGKVDIVIDSDNSEIGLESTVLDIISTPPTVLRPGAVTAEMASFVLGEPVLYNQTETPETPSAPGMKYKHYSPKARLIIVQPENFISLIFNKVPEDKLPGIVCSSSTFNLILENTPDYTNFDFAPVLWNTPEELAQIMFSSFRDMDRAGIDTIYFEAVPETGIGIAIMNRVHKAATH